MIRQAIVAAALLAGGASSASAETVFVGTIKFTAVTPQCQNTHLNDYVNSAFHPKITGNANFAGLSWVWSHAGRGHLLGGLNFDAMFRTVTTGGVGWGDPYIWPAARAAQIAVTYYSPAVASITASTPTVIIRGQIKRPNDDPGGLACVVSFTGMYVKDSTQ